ncbi:MAG: pyruvate dehydrogenase complex dihydrolipoamide acetyltransferase [Roseomonas sp.]|nr:pyruvate dehydrogenase complex dihydrolipoamide acetyltransferase [Roseomonas sp.]MCA3314011.1 pyruvate dehydrogenase complex dihydrolipoamide acetyltransferase [Roseomonas sp.]MCA3316289.1 pyruvate dehydrogenase complex dihydrolipoamide acetyltransferase [Roseomonas sp.]MCA3319911.1 pyruvate dehydrogenase complex dihydrolipoamide acetyltransferase [Roseomonas sp.]MCA3342230.1 pyruvate dehydrogenase complex dihydrolipoamide acetyltransferase [Roseomonas sp.]
MATNILMPALSPTMTEGNLARWLKQEGERIKAGDVIAEIETDKATMEVEAVDEGILGRILVPAGTQGVKVNDVIAVLVEAGEAVPTAGAAPKAAPAAVPAPVAAPVAAAPANIAPAPASGDRVFASPLARRMAAQAGVDISKIAGSGPNGRIVKADVDAALSRGPAPVAAAAPAPTAAPRSAAPVAITAPHTAVPNSSIRKVIARRLAESKATIPHFYVSTDVEIDALLKIRADLNARSPKDGPGAYKLSVNDLVIKATAVTLRRFPNVNAMWTEDAILQLHDVDISVAVSIPDGLITPIVRNADIKGLAAISTEMKDLAARAKTGKLKPEEFQGGGFSISNMGMYGVRDFAAIINPPQAGILAVSAGEQRPVVKNGALAIATVMTLTLSVDHRVIDGALAAEFLQALKRNIEDPLSLML